MYLCVYNLRKINNNDKATINSHNWNNIRIKSPKIIAPHSASTTYIGINKVIPQREIIGAQPNAASFGLVPNELPLKPYNIFVCFESFEEAANFLR